MPAFLHRIASWIPVVCVIAVIATIFLYKGFMNSDSVKDDGKKKYIHDVSTDAVLTKTVISSKKDGIKYWELEADIVRVMQDSDKSRAEGVTCVFYDKAGEKYILFESPSADIDMKTENVVFTEKSRGFMVSSRDILEAGRLEWDGNRKKVLGSGGVVIYRDDYILRGDEMIGDPETKNIELMKNVSGAYLSDGKGKPFFGKK